MVDTVRTMDDLLNNLFQDGQPAGSINEQRMRDLIVSVLGQTGWGAYQDTGNTDLSPQILPAGVPTFIECNGGIVEKQEMPFGIVDFWDVVTNEILIPRAGSGFMVTFELIIRRASGVGAWDVDSYIDIGLPGPVQLYPRTQAASKTSGDKKLTWTTGAYALDTWVLNGGKIFVVPEVDAECYSARVIIHQTHRGRGVY